MHIPLLRLPQQGGGKNRLFLPPAAGQLLQPAEIVPARVGVHPGKDPGRVPGEDGVAAVRPGEQLLRIQGGEEPQGGEQRLQALGIVLGRTAAGELSGEGCQLFQNGQAQRRGKTAQLGPAQGRDRLEALQKERGPRLGDAAPSRQQQGPGQRQDQRALGTAAERVLAAKIPRGADGLTPGQILVVQQPFPGGRDLGCRLRPFLQQPAAAADRPQSLADGGKQAPAADLAPGRQQPGRGPSAGAEPFVFHIGRIQHALHRQILLAYETIR